MLRHWFNVRIGTSTCCTTLGSAPPSDVRPEIVINNENTHKLISDMLEFFFSKFVYFQTNITHPIQQRCRSFQPDQNHPMANTPALYFSNM